MAYQGQFKITSEMFTSELAEENSTEYNKLADVVRQGVCGN